MRAAGLEGAQMTSFSSAVVRRTVAPYRHYRRRIIVRLFADTVSLRLERTRMAYELPVSTLMDIVCRMEAQRIQHERRAKRSAHKTLKRRN
jgi:hypothetical protein